MEVLFGGYASTMATSSTELFPIRPVITTPVVVETVIRVSVRASLASQKRFIFLMFIEVIDAPLFPTPNPTFKL